MQANAPRSLESTGSIDTATHQTDLNHFGFVPASQRQLDDRDVDGAAEETEEGQR